MPSDPDWSINVSLRMLTGESTEIPGNVGNASPRLPAARSPVIAPAPTAVGPRRRSVSAAADPTTSKGTT